MEKKNNLTSCHLPEGFNPHSTADTIRGLTDAVHHLVTEGEMIEQPAPKHALGKLQALADLLQVEVRTLHDYLREIENRTTLRLPMTAEDFDETDVARNQVRETSPVYIVR